MELVATIWDLWCSLATLNDIPPIWAALTCWVCGVAGYAAFRDVWGLGWAVCLGVLGIATVVFC